MNLVLGIWAHLSVPTLNYRYKLKWCCLSEERLINLLLTPSIRKGSQEIIYGPIPLGGLLKNRCLVLPENLFKSVQFFCKVVISQVKHDSFPISSELEHVKYCPPDNNGLLGLLAIKVDDLALAVLCVLSLVAPV